MSYDNLNIVHGFNFGHNKDDVISTAKNRVRENIENNGYLVKYKNIIIVIEKFEKTESENIIIK